MATKNQKKQKLLALLEAPSLVPQQLM